MLKIFFTLFALSTILALPSISNATNDYYPNLSSSDEAEMWIIEQNYYRYGPELRKVALLRMEELKLKLSSEEERVTDYVKNASIPVVADPSKPNLFQALSYVQRAYLLLPLNIKIELSKFWIKDNNLSSLSVPAQEWFESKIVVNSKDQ